MMLGRVLRAIRIRAFPPPPKPLVLMYHRISEEPFDPWGNAVSPAHFAEHLEVLRRTRQPLPLIDFAARLRDGTLPDNAVAVTFDDGYVDNLVAAKPRLAAAGVPATIFLATGYLGQPGEFWWDEIARLVLFAAGPRILDLTIHGRAMRFDLGDDAAAGPWRAWLDPPRTGREKAYLAIWSATRTVPVRERESLLAQVRGAYAGRPTPAGSGRPMTPQEVRIVAGDGLVSIGPHTVTHPALTELDAPSRRREIAASKSACEDLIGSAVQAFAYPFGNLDQDVRTAIREAGFSCACSTRHGSGAAGFRRVHAAARPRNRCRRRRLRAVAALRVDRSGAGVGQRLAQPDFERTKVPLSPSTTLRTRSRSAWPAENSRYTIP